MIVRSDIAKSLEYGGKAQFLDGRQAWPSRRSLIANEVTSTGKSETYLGLGAHPMPVEAKDLVQVRGLTERYIEIENKPWEVTLAVEHRAINDDRVGHVLPWMKAAGQRFEQHMDKLCFQALNGGDGSTYGGLCYDGNEYFDTQHADTGADYTTVQSNVNALTLNLDNFNTVWVAAMAFRDSRGEKVEIPFDLLVVPPALMVMAAQICDNELAYDTANREINPYAGKFRYAVSPHLDATAWTISSTITVDKPIIFQLREGPSMEVWDDENLANAVRYYKWYGRYWLGYGDWRLAVMGNT